MARRPNIKCPHVPKPVRDPKPTAPYFEHDLIKLPDGTYHCYIHDKRWQLADSGELMPLKRPKIGGWPKVT